MSRHLEVKPKFKIFVAVVKISRNRLYRHIKLLLIGLRCKTVNPKKFESLLVHPRVIMYNKSHYDPQQK